MSEKSKIIFTATSASLLLLLSTHTLAVQKNSKTSVITDSLSPSSNLCDSEGFMLPACNTEKIKPILSFQDWLEKLKINGWLDLDAAKYSQYQPTHPFHSGAIIRNARINFRGQVEPQWRYSFGFAFFNNTVFVKQAFLAYTGLRNTEIRIGQMKAPFSLEVLTNDRYTTFLERALPSAILAPEYRLGAGAFHYGTLFNVANTYTIAGGIYTNKAGEKSENTSGSVMEIARATYAYLPSKRRLVMAGLGGELRTPDSNKIISFEGHPESWVSTNTTARLIDTGDITNVDQVDSYDIQGATVYGPLSLQGEFIDDYVDRTNGNPTLHFDGWYAFCSWIMTGESRNYDTRNAVFTGVDPQHHYGAWELTGRASNINLNSEHVLGGKERNYTTGLNWYVNESVRFMFNYIKVFSEKDSIQSDPNIYTVRAEIDFP